MANSLLLTDEFKKKIGGDVVGSVETGPTASELVEGRAGRLGLEASRPGLGISERVSYLNPGEKFAQPERESAVLNPFQMKLEEQRALIDQARAVTRTHQIENAVKGLTFVGDLAKSLAGMPPEVREKMLPQFEAKVSATSPAMTKLFSWMVDHEAIAHLEREEMVAMVLEYSRDAQVWVAGGGDLVGRLATDPDFADKVGADVDKGIARRNMKPAKTKTQQLLRDFETREPERFRQMQDSDGAISVKELEEVVAYFAPEDPDINDPGDQIQLLNVARQYPRALRLRSDPEIAARRKERLKKSTEAEFREPKDLSVTNYITPDGRELLGKTTHEGVFLQDENGAFTVQAPQGTKKVGIQVTGGPEEFLPDPAAAFQAALDTASNIADYTDLLRMLDEGGEGIVGARGWLTENMMGPLAQINQRAAEIGAEQLSGEGGQAKVQAFRTRAQAIVGRAVGELEIEREGRITDAEREIARQAVALTKPGRSFEQVRSGLVSLIQLAVINQDAQIIEAGGKPDPLETRDQKLAFLKRMTGMGMTAKQAKQTLTSNISMRKQIGRVLSQVKGGQ
jgi:hypothetical protein